jgi:hypothetical protein
MERIIFKTKGRTNRRRRKKGEGEKKNIREETWDNGWKFEKELEVFSSI